MYQTGYLGGVSILIWPNRTLDFHMPNTLPLPLLTSHIFTTIHAVSQAPNQGLILVSPVIEPLQPVH